INNTRSDTAHLIRVLVELSQKIETSLAKGSADARKNFAARVKALMHDVPDLPDFTCFHNGFREQPASATSEGDMRAAFFGAYREEQCEHLKIFGADMDRRLREG